MSKVSSSKEERLEEAFDRSEDFRTVIHKHFEHPKLFLTEGSNDKKFRQMDYEGIDAIRVDNDDMFQFKYSNLENTGFTDNPEEIQIPLRYKTESGKKSPECKKWETGIVDTDYIVLVVYHQNVIVHYRIVDYQKYVESDSVELKESCTLTDAHNDVEYKFIKNTGEEPEYSWTHFCY